MRWLVIMALVAGCGGDDAGGTCSYNGHTYAVGDMFPSGDGCNSCSCTSSGVACTERACADDGGIDANPASCAPSGGCLDGPVCGAICCDRGERCDNGVCKCGANAACGTGDSCEAPGPIGTDACGSICCGASGPCPQ
jgi:hypothetical protein